MSKQQTTRRRKRRPLGERGVGRAVQGAVLGKSNGTAQRLRGTCRGRRQPQMEANSASERRSWIVDRRSPNVERRTPTDER